MFFNWSTFLIVSLDSWFSAGGSAFSGHSNTEGNQKGPPMMSNDESRGHGKPFLSLRWFPGEILELNPSAIPILRGVGHLGQRYFGVKTGVGKREPPNQIQGFHSDDSPREPLTRPSFHWFPLMTWQCCFLWSRSDMMNQMSHGQLWKISPLRFMIDRRFLPIRIPSMM